MKLPQMVAMALLGLIATRSDAAILYTTTDLGNSYQLLLGSDGRDYGVAGSDGIVYAFDRTPSKQIDIPVQLPQDPYPVISVTLTLQNGNYQVGLVNENGPVGYEFHPTFAGNSWFNGGHPDKPVIADMNVQGQIVGTSAYYDPTLKEITGSYAAFSAIGAQSHQVSPMGSPGNSEMVDNLNNYIASIPGVSLTSGLSIDDLGRIIAVGSNGHDYLIAPLALGPASTIPEPISVLNYGIGIVVVIGIYRRRSRGPRTLGSMKGTF